MPRNRLRVYIKSHFHDYFFTVFQQRFVIAAVKDVASSGSDEEASTNTGQYLEACNLHLGQGMLSHCRINKNSPVMTTIRKRMAIF